MADTYDRYEDAGGGGGGFVMGLLAGAVIGAGIGMLLAPRAGAELRGNLGEQARTLGNKASEQYRRASEQAGEWAEKGREAVGKAREVVHRGAEEARSFAGSATGSDYGGGTSYNTGSTGSYGWEHGKFVTTHSVTNGSRLLALGSQRPRAARARAQSPKPRA